MKNYKNYKLMAAAVAGLTFLAATAQASIQVSWTGNPGFSTPPQSLTVDYNVVAVSGGYDYQYDFTGSAGISSFQIDGFFVGVTYVSGGNNGSPTPYVLDATANGSITWEFAPLTTSVSPLSLVYFSPNGPTLGYGSANDTASGPYAPTSIANYVAVPVPETTTVMAGALMLLPFGAGVMRTLRKERAA